LTGEQNEGLILAFTFWRLTLPALKPENSALMARNDVRQPCQSFDCSGRNVCSVINLLSQRANIVCQQPYDVAQCFMPEGKLFQALVDGHQSITPDE
jgi:hypothetical protein